MKRNYFDVLVGIVTLALAAAFVLFSLDVTNRRVGQKSYRVYARFDNVDGIGPGAKVKIGGVDVGSVQGVLLEKNYTVLVSIDLRMGTRVPVDSYIKVSTSGLMGGKHLKIDVGGENDILQEGGIFDFTGSAMDLEDMITRFLLGNVSKDK